MFPRIMIFTENSTGVFCSLGKVDMRQLMDMYNSRQHNLEEPKSAEEIISLLKSHWQVIYHSILLLVLNDLVVLKWLYWCCMTWLC